LKIYLPDFQVSGILVIQIDAVIDNDGVLRTCKASGHAGAGKAGNDIVCAAVSVLMRTACSILSGRKGIVLHYGAPEKGQMWLNVDYKADGKDFLNTSGLFLIEGLRSVAQEYPKNCKLDLVIRRNCYGKKKRRKRR